MEIALRARLSLGACARSHPSRMLETFADVDPLNMSEHLSLSSLACLLACTICSNARLDSTSLDVSTSLSASGILPSGEQVRGS